jgi:phospholipid-translocating ATPase
MNLKILIIKQKEVQRFIGSKFIEWDMKMYDKETDQPALANTSDLNEDLGQIEYLFSDKTGTLTENIMEFKQFSIDGIKYEEKNGCIFILNTNKQIDKEKMNAKLSIFLEMLSLCHSVQKDENGAYQASSPDEFCFVNYCKQIGIVYEGDERDQSKRIIRRIKFFNKIKKYELLDTLEFDSTRKRMSVILRDLETNKLFVYCKGAETFIIKKCIQGDFQTCMQDIDSFAEQGWRTLAFSYKSITEQDYKTMKETIIQAYNDILNRSEKLAEAFEFIESGLTLVGATAIEDKLQEDVAITLETIRQAGIKIWVLTGDKKETAINISYSCKHFSNEMQKLIITDLKDRTQIEKLLNEFKNT